MSELVGRLDLPVGSHTDRRLAGVATAVLGCGVVMILAGAAAGSIVLASVGGAMAGLAVVVLMAPRWIEPTIVAALAAPLPAVWSGGGVRIAGAAPLTAAVIAAWVLHRAAARRPLRFGTLPLRTLGLLALTFLVAAAASPHVGIALRKLANLAVLAGLLFAVTDLLCESPALRARVATVLALMGTLCGGLAVLETVGVIPGAFPRLVSPLNRAALGFGQPNSLGLYLAVVLPLVAWQTAEVRGRVQWLWRGALALTTAGLLATFSRGSWGAVIVGAAALAIAGDWRRSFRLMGGALAFAVVLDVVSGGIVRDRIAETVGDWVVEQRGALMLAGVLMFLDRPLVGYGPGGYEAELDRYGIQVPQLWDYEATPHNAYIQMAAETGIVGVILYLVLLWRFIRSAAAAVRSSRGGHDAGLDRALLWSMGIVAVSGMFMWPYALDTGQAVIMLFALVASSPAVRAA